MNKLPPNSIFADNAPLYRDRGYAVVPVKRGAKSPLIKNWASATATSAETFETQRERFADANIGLLAGVKLPNQRTIVFIDIDDERLVPFVCAVAPSICGKIGSKGLTNFYQAEPGLKSVKLRAPTATAPAVEIFTATGQTVVPPSIHPTGKQYRWHGRSLLEIKYDELTILNPAAYAILIAVLKNKKAWEIINGGPEVKGHELMLKLTSSGIANLTDDLDALANALNLLFDPAYAGNTRAETLRMLESARKKGLGFSPRSTHRYDPGDEGPIPLGFTRDGLYAFRDQLRNIVLLASANQLLSLQYLVGLASTKFWASRFPSEKSFFNFWGAGETLIGACKNKGPFNPIKVRGRGVWREGSTIITNFGGPIPADVKNLYLCFDPITFDKTDSFDTERLLKLLKLFRWRQPQDAMLLFGWLALAPICGVLNWRPHCFVYGPPQCGKTTIHSLAARLLHPLAISADGQSSEAGVRQTLGPDSLPILLDEFESDQHGSGLRGVLRLARSASSADTPVLRGTPEGKAMQFSLRTTFFFCAVNAGRMSPADQSRIMLLELMKHDGDRDTAKLITAEEAYFRNLGQQWCGYMLSVAELIGPAIDAFEHHLPSGDKRHRQNFATMLAAAFVALHRRIPVYEEAGAWAEEYSTALDQHAEDIERDNSLECLNHLLARVVDDYPLGHWIATALLDLPEDDNRRYDAERITKTFDIIAKASNEHDGILIRNGSPNVEEVFRGTIWEGRGWERALRGLEGAFAIKNPVHFSGAGQKSRCIGIPTRYLPEPFEMKNYSDEDSY